MKIVKTVFVNNVVVRGVGCNYLIFKIDDKYKKLKREIFSAFYDIRKLLYYN